MMHISTHSPRYSNQSHRKTKFSRRIQELRPHIDGARDGRKMDLSWRSIVIVVGIWHLDDYVYGTRDSRDVERLVKGVCPSD